MKRVALSAAVLLLAACSGQQSSEESAEDFASRIGSESTAARDNPQAAAEMPNTAQAVPPAGADVTALEQLRDIGGVDLGQRDGGCTFMEGNREMIIASGSNDRALPGKAVIRVGGGLTVLDAPPGGLSAIRAGTTFTGEGVTVQVAPAAGDAASRPANVSVTGADGKSATYSGKWICA